MLQWRPVSKWASTRLNGYCGLCILALYFLYLNLVRGMLSIFDCSKNADGILILDADPSVRCNVVRFHVDTV